MLTRKQREVAAAVYEGRLSENELAERFGITVKQLRKLSQGQEFKQELARLCEAAERETRLIINRYGPIAAAKLVTLLDSEKDDTARRTALDMIDRCLNTQTTNDDRNESDAGGISDEQARGMLLTLANGIKRKAT